MLTVALLGACQAKVQTNPNGGEDGGTDSASTGDDAAPDSVVLGAWGTPEKITPAATAGQEDDGTLSSNGLELVFALVETADLNRKHLYYASRAQLTDGFGPITRLPFDLTGTTEQTPRFSADDKILYFASDRAPTLGGLDIWQVDHVAPGAANFTNARTVPGVSTASTDKWFMPCGTQGLYVVATNGHLAEGKLGAGPAVQIPALASAVAGQAETGTFLTQDCLTIYFASNRVAPMRMFTATRSTVTDPWPAPTQVNDFNILGGNQQDPWISPDNRIFVFASDAAGVGNNDEYISTR
jgi:WD40 repeat protein